MKRAGLRSIVLVGLASIALARAPATPPADPFALLAPDVTLNQDDRQKLDRGDTIARLLSGHGHQVAVFVAMNVAADGDRLVAWVRQIAQLRKSPYVLGIARFSDPPQLSDVASLSLDDDDLDAIRHCRPGDCSVKLSGAEMATLRAAATGQGTWKPAAQDAFRRVVLDRVRRYLAGGLAAIGPYEDKDHPLSLANTFSALLAAMPFFTTHVPAFSAYLDGYPRAPMPGVESFLYWSKDHLSGKPQTSVTHVAILRGSASDPFDAIVAGRQVFATHYTDGSLSLTVILRGATPDRHYLVYVNRTSLDVIGGLFGGLVRRIVEHRLKGESPAVLRILRDRLESGDPPGTSGATESRAPRVPDA